MKFIIGKKQDMTRKFTEDGTMIPVTRVIADPCLVMGKKHKEKDGYKSILLANEQLDEKKVNKPMMGAFEKAFGKKTGYRNLKEFRLNENDPIFDKVEVGQEIDVTIFSIGDKVKVQGTSKGRGFQGVVKRHHFGGGKKSHGHKDQLRMPGSIGATGPSHVFKGKRMAGHMGDEKVTLSNLEVVEIIPENNEIWLKGAVPGGRGNLLYIKAAGDFDLKKKELVIEETEKASEEPATVVEAVVSSVAEESKAEIVEVATDNNQTEEKTN